MSVSNGQKGNASTFNNAFASLLSAVNFLGSINLKRPIGSGDEVIDLQATINDLKNSAGNADSSIESLQNQINELEGGFYVNTDTSSINEDGILVLENKKLLVRRVAGDAVSVNANLIPFGGAEYVDPLGDGMIVRLIGVSNTETFTLRHNDNDYGCILNGDIELNRFRTIDLMWAKTEKRFVEISRNG